ncbi:uncharacterized protein LOC144108830 isoform X2 [Amblyomma americanum]
MSSFRKSTEIFKVPATPSNKKQGETAVKTPTKSAPQEARLDRSPWAVISPVAKYINEKPVPPLVKTVRGRKWLSTKSLTAATTPDRMPQSPGPSKPRAASLPEKRYRSSNTGMLNKIGVTPLVTPTKPIVIKHTVAAETGNENETDLQDSVLEVIQH